MGPKCCTITFTNHTMTHYSIYYATPCGVKFQHKEKSLLELQSICKHLFKQLPLKFTSSSSYNGAHDSWGKKADLAFMLTENENSFSQVSASKLNETTDNPRWKKFSSLEIKRNYFINQISEKPLLNKWFFLA